MSDNKILYVLLAIGSTISDNVFKQIAEIKKSVVENVNDNVIRTRAVGNGKVKDFTAPTNKCDAILDKEGDIVGHENFATRLYHYGVKKILWLESFVCDDTYDALFKGIRNLGEYRKLDECENVSFIKEKINEAWAIDQRNPFRAKNIKQASIAKSAGTKFAELKLSGLTDEEIASQMVTFFSDQNVIAS